MRIVIVGAGTGGTLTANLLASELRHEMETGEVRITIAESSPVHTYQPGSLDVAFRGVAPDKFQRPTTKLLDKHVSVVAGAQRIDPAARQVMLDEGRSVPYDVLILATGSVGRWDLIPGLETAATFHGGPHKAQEIWQALQGMKEGRIVVAITEMPYKCPPSPNEACFLLDDYFTKRGDRGRFEIKMLTPMPRAYPAAAISDQVEERFTEKDIQLGPFWMSDRVEGGYIYNMEGDAEPFDLLIAIPPHRGAEIVARSGLGDEEGWVRVDKGTMRMAKHPEIYALGDCTALPISKSGVVAHLQALVVVKNILAQLKKESSWRYNGRINCPMEVGDHKLLWVSATYDSPPEPNQPTYVKYLMKKAFGKMYWRVLSGDLEWMMRKYFGETAERETGLMIGEQSVGQ